MVQQEYFSVLQKECGSCGETFPMETATPTPAQDIVQVEEIRKKIDIFSKLVICKPARK